MRRPAMIIVAATALAGTAWASEPLTLRGAMAQAREHALEVSAARARQDAAAARLAQAKGVRLPSVHLEENWIRTDSPAEAFALKLNQERFSFPQFMTSDPNKPAALDTAISRIELSLPIFTGGELSGRIEQASEAASSAADQASWVGTQAAEKAAQAYVTLSQAEEYVSLIEHARDTVKAHVDLARDYEAQGMLVRSEVLRAEVELAHIDDLLAEAKGNARLASANLAFCLGTDQGGDWQLAPLPKPTDLDEGLDAWLKSAEKRKDLEAARRMLRAGELEESVRRAAFLPKVGLVARGDLVDDRLFGSHGNSTAIMAQATINVFQGGADKAALAAARFEAKAGKAEVQRFEEGVRLQVRQAFEEATTARLRYATAIKALGAAREAERITKERFATGVVKMLDLLDASTARREAETRELVARAEAHAALLRLAAAAGREPESVLP